MPIIHDILLPVGYRSLKGRPNWSTTIETDGGGGDESQINWDQALYEYDVVYLRSNFPDTGAFERLVTFFHGRRGRGYGFLVFDGNDNTDMWEGESQGLVKFIDGAYRLVKCYPDTVNPYYRLITRPIVDEEVVDALAALNPPQVASVVVLGGGAAEGTLDPETGIVTGIEEEGTWSGSFLVPCRFVDDHLEYENQAAGMIISIEAQLEEVRVD